MPLSIDRALGKPAVERPTNGSGGVSLLVVVMVYAVPGGLPYFSRRII